nr:hypothetical protein [Aeropyrum camini]
MASSLGDAGGGDMPFKPVAEAFASMERITSRTQLTLLLTRLFKSTPRGDRHCRLPDPGEAGARLEGAARAGGWGEASGEGDSLAYKATEERVEKLYKSIGDLGSVAERLSREYRARASRAVTLEAFMAGGGEALTVRRVYNTLYRIAMAQGEGSRDIKLRLLAGLLADAEPVEAKYIVRFVEGRLRVGVGDATILDALAMAFGGGATPGRL